MNKRIARGASIVAAALLAACSGTSPSSSTLPSAFAGTHAPAIGSRHHGYGPIKGRLDPVRLIRLQAEGKLPAIAPRSAMRQILKYVVSHHKVHFALRRGTGVPPGMWVSNFTPSYLLGQSASGKTTVAAIDTTSNGCNFPTGLKVDHSQNLWVACESSTYNDSGSVLEYSSGGILLNTYHTGCPINIQYCTGFQGYGVDVAENSSTVFAPIAYYNMETCTENSPPHCTYLTGSGFEYWPTNSPSSPPMLISLNSNEENCDPLCTVDFADLDASGNLWFTYDGCYGDYNYYYICGSGIGQVTDPTTPSWAFNQVVPVGSYDVIAGGVYISQKRGTYSLNVVDRTDREILQYHFPVSGTPYNTLGPTPLNTLGLGQPIAGGFNQTDSKLALADALEWLDIGKVTGNTWKAVSNPNFNAGLSFLLNGAAYTPSDK
jgi:hypothetical protein